MDPLAVAQGSWSASASVGEEGADCLLASVWAAAVEKQGLARAQMVQMVQMVWMVWMVWMKRAMINNTYETRHKATFYIAVQQAVIAPKLVVMYRAVSRWGHCVLLRLSNVHSCLTCILRPGIEMTHDIKQL